MPKNQIINCPLGSRLTAWNIPLTQHEIQLFVNDALSLVLLDCLIESFPPQVASCMKIISWPRVTAAEMKRNCLGPEYCCNQEPINQSDCAFYFDFYAKARSIHTLSGNTCKLTNCYRPKWCPTCSLFGKNLSTRNSTTDFKRSIAVRKVFNLPTASWKPSLAPFLS